MVRESLVKLRNSVTAEHMLLLGALTLSTWAYLQANTFRQPADLFPQFTSMIIIIGSTLLLFRNYLPGPIRAFATESPDLMANERTEKVTEIVDTSSEVKSGSDVDNKSANGIHSRNLIEFFFNGGPFSLTFLTGIYILLAYLFGFIWATPVFAALYSLAVEHPWYIIIGLIVGTTAIVYTFNAVLVVPLDDGVLRGDIL